MATPAPPATPAPQVDYEHHIIHPMVYARVLAALLVLMFTTVYVARFNLPDIGPISGTVVNQTVALVIAVAKALLVILFFMGVKYSTSLTKLWSIAGFLVFSLMFLILGDYASRPFEAVPSWDRTGESAMPRGFPTGSVVHPSNNLNLRPRG